MTDGIKELDRSKGMYVGTYTNIPIIVDMPKKFKEGRWYYDAVSRKWKVLSLIHYGDCDVLIVRQRWHLRKICVAFTEPDGKTATVLFKGMGWTTIYVEEEE